MRPRRTFVLLVIATTMAGTPAPAVADPAGPTHYQSRITELLVDGQPTSQAELPVDVEVLGGDAFLVVHVDEGAEVEVPGYRGEPYVRIGADGVVEVNQRSESRWANDERYGPDRDERPGQIDHDAPPAWAVVASDGSYAWHDHRIHYMSPSVPQQVDPDAGEPQLVQPWEVPITVDGRELLVRGELVWLPGPSAVLPVALLLLAVAVGAGAALAGTAVSAGLVGLGLVGALGVGIAASVGLPAGADAEPMLVVLPAVAAVLLGAGALLRRREPGSPRGPIVALAAGVPLAVWGLIQVGALYRPVVPGPLPVGAVRLALALALSAGVAALVSGVRAALAAGSLGD
jgi:hypothetical protein